MSTGMKNRISAPVDVLNALVRPITFVVTPGAYQVSVGAGMHESIGAELPLGPGQPPVLIPLITGQYNSVVSVGLKPGFVVVVPVVRKEFKGSNPWIMVSDFHMKIDGCVGQSFVRSYSTLTRITDESDVVISYVGATKAV